MKSRFCFATLLALCLALTGLCASAPAAELPIVNGKHWQASSEKEKKAFLLGAATIIKLEHEVQGNEPLPKEKSLIASWVAGLSKYTLTDVQLAVDAYYKNNPDKLERSVVEVVWYELTLPNLAAQ